MRRVTIISALAIFCLLLLPQTEANDAGKTGKNITFNKDVASIFYKSCTECHRPGEIAPFSLLSYKDARPWAKSIREKVVSREMPPWHADPNHGEWHNDRRLTRQEIDKIVAWIDGGAREGDPKDLPPVPKFVDGWAIGQPDETFSIPQQDVPETGTVAYKYFQAPTNYKEDHWITAAEIRSSARSAVHHVIVFIQDPNGSGRTDGNLLAGTAPGEQPSKFLPGFARRVPAGAKLTFQMHYTPNGKATKDITTIGLKYAKEPPKHQVYTRPVLNMKFAIPAGDSNYQVISQYTFTEDAHLTSLMPHMHLRGKDFEIKVISPDGTSKILLNVPKYDFNWQTYYVPKSPIAIPKGTKIECTAHFDNSANNKYNPDPTKEVKWGEQTWEEMMIGWLSYYYDNASGAKPAEKPMAASTSGNSK